MRRRSGSPRALRAIFCSNNAGLLSPTAAHPHQHLWPTFASRTLALSKILTTIGKLLGYTQVQTTPRGAPFAKDFMQTAAAHITGSIGAKLLTEPAESAGRRNE